MPTNTYVALATQTLTSTAATVTFSSIPQGYTDLILISSPTASGGYDLVVRFNGDTASNYSNTILSGTGSSAISARLSNQTIMYLDYYGVINTTQTNRIINIMNYSNSTTYKTVLSRANNAGSGTDAIVGLWRNTAAITSLVLIAQTGGTFAAGSTFSLYGIKSEEAASKATGGMVTSDANYYYHTFLASGTFTPKQSLTADVLQIAGGGGGNNGGGGAGGLRDFSAQALTATNYTVTVGAGGTAGAGGGGAFPAAGVYGNPSQFASLTVSTGGGGGDAGNGGSGAGGAANFNGNSGGSASPSGQGNSGGNASGSANGGGGGATAGGATASGSDGGVGGNGSSSYSSWGLATGTGQNVSGTYWYAGGGGGGGSNSNGAVGGNGGGGRANNGTNTIAGTANTGGGGGGKWGGSPAAGGSGIVIVRYAK